jgi:glutamyl-tRNA synthetase
MSKIVRTRFAPSPTGYLHTGAVRTALFAWLVARQNQGEFILRIEDTDKSREVEGAVRHIEESLEWLELDWDKGGSHATGDTKYLQSERLDIYTSYAKKLLEEGKAYADTTTPDQLKEWREQAKSEKRPFHFNQYRPEPVSWQPGMPIRLKVDAAESPAWTDIVRGQQAPSRENLDDFILIKADGFPTYNFAHIVDDYDMGITHVIRGEEFVSSMPKFLMLYDALGLELPKFAHLPNILTPEGNKKLSKREGAPDILQYRDQGYLPDAVINFLALMGWNDGTEQEVYTVPELIEKFDLTRVQKSGARYDEDRLKWLSGQHVREKNIDDLYDKTQGFWPLEAESYGENYKKQVLGLVQERLKYLAELPELTRFFFKDLPVDPELISSHKQLKKLDKPDLKTLLETTKAELQESDFSSEDLTNRLNGLLILTHTKPAVLFSLIRIATTQTPASPGLAETLAVLGRDTALRRLDQQIAAL